MSHTTRDKLAAAKQAVQRLERQLELEEKASATAGAAARALAVELHRSLCKRAHPARCSWFAEEHADEADAANWTHPAHARWLKQATETLAAIGRAGYDVQPQRAL
jgi:hypothetical protein